MGPEPHAYLTAPRPNHPGPEKPAQIRLLSHPGRMFTAHSEAAQLSVTCQGRRADLRIFQLEKNKI